MAVHFIVMYVYYACVCHIMHGMSMNTAPLYHLSTIACACPLHAAICQFSSSNCPAPLEPLVDSLVACQRLTSLKLRDIFLYFQRFLAVVKGMHNLRALGLESVQFLDHLFDEEDKGVSVFEVCLHS